MEKRIPYGKFQSVKRVAQACDPLITKRNALLNKIKTLQEEANSYQEQIESLEQGIVKMVGFHVEDLVKKVIEEGIDVNGKPKKTTKYVTTDVVSYDAEKKQYVINMPDEEKETYRVPMESAYGSDFDIDKEKVMQDINPVEQEAI